MSDLEKINIYVPENTGYMLNYDATQFEVWKKDGCTINRNRFLNMLIKGYYNAYIIEYRRVYDYILKELERTSIRMSERELIAENILKHIVLPEIPKRKGKNPIRLSLKPIEETENLILKIMNDLGENDFISQYFCRMLISYCEKSLSERERIIFREMYDFLQEACQIKQLITFSTIWDSKKIYEVFPYDIVVGQEEMYNYLLCGEVNEKTGLQEAKAYRLNRISKPNYSNSTRSLSDDVIRHLEMMKLYGPQYSINDDEETCVKLTDAGIRSLNRIYFGRPTHYNIEKKENGNFYYFKCSKDQLYLYFRRLGRDAEIIYPESLRKRMQDFHLSAFEKYKGGSGNTNVRKNGKVNVIEFGNQ